MSRKHVEKPWKSRKTHGFSRSMRYMVSWWGKLWWEIMVGKVMEVQIQFMGKIFYIELFVYRRVAGESSSQWPVVQIIRGTWQWPPWSQDTTMELGQSSVHRVVECGWKPGFQQISDIFLAWSPDELVRWLTLRKSPSPTNFFRHRRSIFVELQKLTQKIKGISTTNNHLRICEPWGVSFGSGWAGFPCNCWIVGDHFCLFSIETFET